MYNIEGLWRNGSASDSRSDGWAFESLWPQFLMFWTKASLKLIVTEALLLGNTYAHRGARTHDHKIKSLALYRLS